MFENFLKGFREESLEEEPTIVVAADDNEKLNDIKARVKKVQSRAEETVQKNNTEDPAVAAALASIEEETESATNTKPNLSTPPSKTTMPSKMGTFVPPLRSMTPNTDISKESVPQKRTPEKNAEQAHLAETRLQNGTFGETESKSPSLDERVGGSDVLIDGVSEITDTLAAIGMNPSNENAVQEEFGAEDPSKQEEKEISLADTTRQENSTGTIEDEASEVEETSKAVDAISNTDKVIVFKTPETKSDSTPVNTEAPAEVQGNEPVDTGNVKPFRKPEITQNSNQETEATETLAEKPKLSPAMEQDIRNLLKEADISFDEEDMTGILQSVAENIGENVNLVRLLKGARTPDGRPLEDIFGGEIKASVRKRVLAKTIEDAQGMKQVA